MSEGERETVDALMGGRFQIVQGRDGHRAGHDALLLASTVPCEAKGSLLDMGCGSGTVAFACLARTDALEAVLVDRDAVSIARARKGISLNGWNSRARAVNADVATCKPDRTVLRSDTFDLVVANPPFNDATHRASPDVRRAAAHVDVDLPTWIRTARRVLKSGGRGTFIVRPDALALFLDDGGRGVTLRSVHSRQGAKAKRVLVSWRKGSKAALSILPSLTMHEADGAPTAQARAVLEGTP